MAATLAPGTLLYHGRSDSSIPTTPEWLATDPEHSFLFCNGVCYLVTLVATREMRLVYFDGSSANKLNTGTLDSQDILLWGEVDNDKDPWNEGPRFEYLCAWGKPYGIDGYVR